MTGEGGGGGTALWSKVGVYPDVRITIQAMLREQGSQKYVV